jgi:hypothetical protein
VSITPFKSNPRALEVADLGFSAKRVELVEHAEDLLIGLHLWKPRLGIGSQPAPDLAHDVVRRGVVSDSIPYADDLISRRLALERWRNGNPAEFGCYLKERSVRDSARGAELPG